MCTHIISTINTKKWLISNIQILLDLKTKKQSNGRFKSIEYNKKRAEKKS